jgi:hypothetical protein
MLNAALYVVRGKVQGVLPGCGIRLCLRGSEGSERRGMCDCVADMHTAGLFIYEGASDFFGGGIRV